MLCENLSYTAKVTLQDTQPGMQSRPHPHQVIVSGIHTDAGKTVVSAALALKLGATYWKPVQSGADDTTPGDTEHVQAWTGHQVDTWPEVYRLALPQSPHWAAEAAGLRLETAALALPPHNGPLVIEGAGGLLVPLNSDTLYLDVFKSWRLPVVLVVKLYLGCINHTLLSLQALAAAGIPVAGIVYNGAPQPQVESAIERHARVHIIGRMPWLHTLDHEALQQAAKDWLI